MHFVEISMILHPYIYSTGTKFQADSPVFCGLVWWFQIHDPERKVCWRKIFRLADSLQRNPVFRVFLTIVHTLNQNRLCCHPGHKMHVCMHAHACI